MILLISAVLLLAPQEKTKELKAGEMAIKVPETWEVVEDKTLLTFVSPQEGPTDTFRENLRINATDSGGATIDALFAASIKSVESAESTLKIAGKGSLTANGHKVLWMSMKPRKPQAGQEPLTLVEYGFVYGGKAYSFKAMEPKAGK